jgi:hypothetical protein
MSVELFLSLTGLALATLWTPGPNNAMLASSGATHGLRATAPHALGVALGFGLMLGCVGLGLGAAFEARPALGIAMKYASAAVLIWIAWKIGTAGGLRSARGAARPVPISRGGGLSVDQPQGLGDGDLGGGAGGSRGRGARPGADRGGAVQRAGPDVGLWLGVAGGRLAGLAGAWPADDLVQPRDGGADPGFGRGADAGLGGGATRPKV